MKINLKEILDYENFSDLSGLKYIVDEYWSLLLELENFFDELYVYLYDQKTQNPTEFVEKFCHEIGLLTQVVNLHKEDIDEILIDFD